MLQEEFELTLPAQTQADALPPGCENQELPLRWRVEWTSGSKGKLIARMHAELVRGELSSAETIAFQKQLRELLSSLASDVMLFPLAPSG